MAASCVEFVPLVLVDCYHGRRALLWRLNCCSWLQSTLLLPLIAWCLAPCYYAACMDAANAGRTAFFCALVLAQRVDWVPE